MTLDKNIVENFANNWDKISAKVKKHWEKLSDEELENIEGSYDNLVKALKEAYGYTARVAKADADEFLEQLNRSTLQTVKQNIQHGVESLYAYKDKVYNCEKNTAHYIKQNPLKSVGAAVAAGFVVSRLINLIT
jgi:ElaB/YqjD/DUF883 family membrane-anchored ribosome-binding protein